MPPLHDSTSAAMKQRLPMRHVGLDAGVPSTAEWAPLMMGGSDRTVLLASRTTGYTMESKMSGTNFLSFWSCSSMCCSRVTLMLRVV